MSAAESSAGADGDRGGSVSEVAASAGVSPATLRRWAGMGIIPQYDGRWTPAAAAHARIAARLRARGHTLEDIRAAVNSGRLAFGYVEDVFPSRREERVTIEEAARRTDLEPALIERLYEAMGFGTGVAEQGLAQTDYELLQYMAAALGAGFPLIAVLQLARVYGQAITQMADAEVRLFHLYVHEPLMRDGVPGLELAEEMGGLVRELLPLAAPVMERVHRRFLRHFIEQDVIGHMEGDADGAALDLGRLRVAIAFADLAGYTRLTEEQGDEEAVDAVERFISAVESTLPDDARVVKTIGDEVMIAGSDPAALVDWSVGFQTLATERPRPRIGLHYGETLYRDGDYYGREVNLAARVAARSAGGEVLVTRPVVEAAGPHLEFERIAEVRLKGFRGPTELFLASAGTG